MSITRTLRAFGWLEVAGGLWGLLTIALHASDNLHSTRELTHLLTLCEFVLFSTAVIAGYRLARDLPGGRGLTVVIQAITAIQFAVPAFSFAAYVGGEVCVGQTLTDGDPTAFAGLGGQFIFHAPGPAAAPFFTLNLLALAVVGLILRERRLPWARLWS